MKLRNKLLPLTGIAAVAASVVPLASCGNTMKMVDITKGYIPSTKSSVKDEATQQEATQLYIDDVTTNSKIFTEDFLYGLNDKINYIKRQFMQTTYASATKFTLNSLQSAVSTPKFGTTQVSFPGRKPVTYPTASFSYKISLKYTYEYIGAFYQGAALPWVNEDSGYHSRTISFDFEVSYNNVPFVAMAQTDDETGQTYWEVTPFQTSVISAMESGTPTIQYYTAQYIYQYMTDAWSIQLNGTGNEVHKYVTTNGYSGTEEKTVNYNRTFKSYQDLEDLIGTTIYAQWFAYDWANITDMAMTLSNWGFKSYYLSTVAQKPELQFNDNMQGYASVPNKNAFFGAFLVPQEFKGDIKLFSGYAEDGKTPTGDIVLTCDETEVPLTITLTPAEGTGKGFILTPDKRTGYEGQYGVENAAFDYGTGSAPTEGTYNFKLPTYFVAQFVPSSSDKDPWTQRVYINQNTLPIYVED